MKRLLAILFAAVGTAVVISAQNTLKVDAPDVVGADEQFTVTFIIEGEDSPSGFQWTPGDKFQLVWGPQQGRTTSVQVINGKKTKSSQFTYTYVLLPKESGTFSLPPATAKFKGREMSSSQVTIEVVADSSSGNQGNSASPGQRGSSISDDDIFMKLILDRTKVVVGEPVTATLKLYQRVNVVGFEDARFPSFNGFWSQEVETPANIEFKRESLDNRIYNTAVLRKYVLVPQQTGTITIDPAELVCLVNVRISSGGGTSIFDGFFDDYRTIRKRVTTASGKVAVAALPPGAPESFGGGVGDFSISARMSKDTLATHEASSLVITVSGKGNVSLLEAPKVSFPPDFEVYDTKVSEKTAEKSGGTSGSKIYEFPFIPRSHGDFTVDRILYSYYDVGDGKYKTLSSGPLHVHVRKGNVSDAATVSPAPSLSAADRSGVKNLGNDIRYIHTKLPSFSSKGDFFVSSAAFRLVLILLVVLGIAVWAVLKNILIRRADIVGTRTRKATKMAMRRLKLAEDYLDKNLYSAFYEELHKAVLGFVSDKLNIHASDLTKEKIAETLASYGIGDDLVRELLFVLDACEFARYSPDAGNEAMQGHYRQALDAISSIDSNMKNKKKHASGPLVLIVGLTLCLPFGASASETDAYLDSLWTKASAEYAAGQWDQALSTYSSIDRLGVESASLYCNIGSSYFKMDDYPHAVLYYERALKIDPSYSDARYNLGIVSGLIRDKIDPVPEFILKDWMRALCYMLDSDSWAAVFLLMSAITVAMVLLFLLAASSAARKTGFSLAIVSIIFASSSLSFSLWQKNDYMRDDSAIVMRPVASVKSSPSEEMSKDLFILHEGTKVRILDEVGEWSNIELADGRQGWIFSRDMEVI